MTSQYYYNYYGLPNFSGIFKPYEICGYPYYIFIREKKNAYEYNAVIATKQKNVFVCRAIIRETFSTERDLCEYVGDYFINQPTVIKKYACFFNGYKIDFFDKYLMDNGFSIYLDFKDFAYFETSINQEVHDYFDRDLYVLILSNFRHFYDCADEVVESQVDYYKKVSRLLT